LRKIFLTYSLSTARDGARIGYKVLIDEESLLLKMLGRKLTFIVLFHIAEQSSTPMVCRLLLKTAL